jgi:hypothetical protein
MQCSSCYNDIRNKCILSALRVRVRDAAAPVAAAQHVHRETFLFHAKKSNLAAAATLPMARALQRAVVSTCRRFF